jgi:hypothetical protein
VFANPPREYLARYGLTFSVVSPGEIAERQEWLSIKNPSGTGEIRGTQNNGRYEVFFNPDGTGWPSVPTGMHSTDYIAQGRLLLGCLRTGDLPSLDSLLQTIGVYSFVPESIRQLQRPNPGCLLERDGKNLASILATIKQKNPDLLSRVRDYLSLIAPEVEGFDLARYGEYETVRFTVTSDSRRLGFDAASMSDGTLRALAALLAAFQIVPPYGHPSLVGIEEPEASLHPAAVRTLVSALAEATQYTQILLTTHSTDLLAEREIALEQLLVVRNCGGTTRIGPVDAASREILRKELSTLADLQRMDQLDPDATDLARQAAMPPND